jgi:hypothetical protein
VAIGSLIGLAVYAGIDVNLLEHLTGTAEALSVIPVIVLLALVVAGLAVAVVDTSRIRHADAAVQVSAKGSVSHYPLYAHAHRYPPRHRSSWVFVIIMLVAMTGITVFILPAEVNSWAYVVGAESQARTSTGAARCRSGSRSRSTTHSGPGAAGGPSPVVKARRSRRSSRACSSME